jgi:hypothetical protein
MSKYIGTPVVSLSVDTVDVSGDITATDSTPELILLNDTHEDTDGGREGKVTFKGEQSGGEVTVLAQIQSGHDGTSDDEKGDLIFKTNDGSDGASPTEVMRIDSDGDVGIGTNDPEARLSFGSFIPSDGQTIHTYHSGTTRSGLGIVSGQHRMFTSTSATLGFGHVSTTDGSTFTERMRIDSSGKVGIGLTNAADYYADQLVVNAPSEGGITMVGPTAHENYIMWADGTSGTEAYKGYIGYSHATNTLRFGANAAEAMRITNGGKILAGMTGVLGGFHNASTIQVTGANQGISITSSGAGTQSPVAVWQQNSSGYLQYFTATSSNTKVGEIFTNGSSTSFGTSSDYRLKENVTDISDGITRVKQLAPKRFNFIADADTTVDGFLAHEAQTVVPEAVTGTKDAMTEEVLYVDGDEIPEGKEVGDVKTASTIDPQGIDQSKLVPLLTAALQEAIAKIETLETKVAALEGE